jgi:hypothetical protein
MKASTFPFGLLSRLGRRAVLDCRFYCTGQFSGLGSVFLSLHWHWHWHPSSNIELLERFCSVYFMGPRV